MKAGITGSLIALAALASAGSCLAAGGHHAVDDAAILKQGECEAEAWANRASGGEHLVHAGVNCGLGFVELGFAAEHPRAAGESETGLSLQAKTAHALSESFSIGAALQSGWLARAHLPHSGTIVLGMATWAPHDQLTLHFNLGRDLVNGGDDATRGGISAEWAANASWVLVAERYLEQQTHFLRAGVRWLPAERWQLDLSAAKRLSGPNPSTWTLGVTYGWD